MKRLLVIFILVVLNLPTFAENVEFEPIYLDDVTNNVVEEKHFDFIPTIKLKVERTEINKELKYNHVEDLDMRSFLRNFQNQEGSALNNLNIYQTENFENVSIYFGRNPMDRLNTSQYTFVTEKDSNYYLGTQISGNTDMFDYSFAISNSVYKRNNAGAISLSTRNNLIKDNFGALKIGAAYYQNDSVEGETTSGVFGQYKYKKLSLTAQIASTKYTGLSTSTGTAYFSPELNITKNLSVNYKHKQDFSGILTKDSVGFKYRPSYLKDNDFMFKMDAVNINEKNSNPRQQFTLTTEFKI